MSDDDSGTVVFSRKKRETDMDMTPMVDVVFLLLIFFMVTAAFGLQKSIAVPDPESEQSTQQAAVLQNNSADDQLTVQITKENKVYVENEEAATQQELYAKLREHQYRNGQRQRRHLFIDADSKAMHETVVRVLDAASGTGMDSIRLMSSE
ncbi:MAG: biopolymer transporter ExbD [Planctomycetaceae bacterium]|nr:biopolymer transporter ExbD [Planctomycetaceae bacterium]